MGDDIIAAAADGSDKHRVTGGVVEVGTATDVPVEARPLN